MTTPDPDPLRPAVEACAAGTLPPNVALLQLATLAARPEEVEAALLGACEGGGPGAARLCMALGMWRANPQAFGTVKAVLAGVDHAVQAEDPEAGLAQCAGTFDRLAATAPEGGVALYALGSADLLAAATDEVVARLGEWSLLGPDRRVLEIGCGMGRFVAALAPLVVHVTGLDLSPGMIERARERCAELPNVALGLSLGRDLRDVPDGDANLVLAADVFPYLVQAGVAEAHVAEAARVLRPRGHLLILNFSYRGDPAQDRAEVAALAERHGFAVQRAAEGDFAHWDAATFLLQRP
jgi:SAM-dependent methyltransferase